jgi:signal transduction histidine kinase
MKENSHPIDQLLQDIAACGILDAIGDGLSIQDTTYKVLYQNAKAKDIIGTHVGEFCYRAFEKRDNVCEACPLQDTFKDGKSRTVVRQNPSFDNPLIVEITSSPIKGPNGHIIAGIEAVRDITERKKMHDLIAQSQKDWEETFDIINDAITIHDKDFNVIRANRGTEELLGIPMTQILGQKCYKSFHNTGCPPEICPGGETLKKGAPAASEVFEPSLNKYLEFKTLPRFDKHNQLMGYIQYVRDISERKKEEEKLADLNAELTRRTHELGQILYVTSHDLRSPLVNIDGFSKELTYSVKELLSLLESEHVSSDIKSKISSIVTEDIPESMKFIQTGISHISSLISGILQLSRTGKIELTIEDIDMNEMMPDIIANYEFTLKKLGVRLEVSPLPSCRGDKKQINRVFSNLIDNAIKYLDAERPGIIKISGFRENSFSVYCVEDNGTGIESQYKDKIFEIFHRLEPGKIEGEGLGLTIVKKLVDRHNGKIWVESAPDNGSKFFVSLPV